MTKNEKIFIGSDHGGFRLKSIIKKYLEDAGVTVEDVGCHTSESCDYPAFGKEVAKRVAGGEGRGILICGSGLGMSMVANKVRGIRAALAGNEYMAKMSRRHNDANILVLGERVLGEDLALSIVEAWLKTEFEGGRHQRRIDLIEQD